MNNPKRNNPRRFRQNPLVWLISCQVAMLMGFSGLAQARDYFNPALLEIDNPDQRGVDLSVFEVGGIQAPGKYRVDVYVNREMVDTRDIDFFLGRDSSGRNSLQPCLGSELLETLGVRVDAIPAIKAGEKCVNLTQVIPQSSSTFRFGQQRLELSIPQAALKMQARGYVSPNKWNSGIPVLLANYSFSGANDKARRGDSHNSDSYYLNLRSGLNLGAWRLRNYSTWNRDSSGGSQWRSINTYLQRDIIALKSRLTLGDSSSASDVFDSVSFRGAQLTSDDDMLPDSMKGYAPVVRGIAKSNAQITIRQSGYVIYQSYVPPGPFEINDLYPTSGSGDLNVTIKEADGSEQNMTVPFASVPVLQREGRFKYSIASGQFRSYLNNIGKRPFTQATGIYGLPWGATLYGGIQAASKYQALALGWGQNLGLLGALSADVTQAWTKPELQPKEHGQSWRLRYGKSFAETGTSFSLASYRYSTKGFYTMQEALETYTNGASIRFPLHKKSRSEVTMNQNLWEGAGTLSFSLMNEEFWNDRRRSQSVSMGYNNSWSGISYGLYYTFVKNGYSSDGNRTSNEDHVVAFNVSVPLSRWLPGANATYSVNSSRNGKTSNRVGLHGSALDDQNLNYSVSQGYTSQGQGASGNVNVDYRGGLGQMNVGYGYDRDTQRLSYGVQGGILLHEDGVTLSQSLGDTVALVKAPGAKGVRIENQTGVTTDWRGYAVVPYQSPYRRNNINLDTTTLPDDVDMTLTSQAVIPTRGAVVRAEFKTNIGQRVLMTLLRQGGAAVPFGATVTDLLNPDNSAAIVGDGGQVYLSGLADSGKLNVKWGKGAAQQCQVTYRLDAKAQNSAIRTVNAQCL